MLQGNDTARKANTVAVIDFILSHTLRMFHPFLPFITEELWHGMGYSSDMPEEQGGKTIMFAPWPKPLDDDFKSFYGLSDTDEKFIETRNELIVQGRDLRRQANIPANKKVKFIFKPSKQTFETEVLKLLLNAEAVEVNPNYQPAQNALAVRHELGELYLPLEGLVDTEAEKRAPQKGTGKNRNRKFPRWNKNWRILISRKKFRLPFWTSTRNALLTGSQNASMSLRP